MYQATRRREEKTQARGTGRYATQTGTNHFIVVIHIIKGFFARKRSGNYQAKRKRRGEIPHA
jgi:hypothetical protein